MKDNGFFNQDEVKMDIDKMMIYRIERSQLSDEEMANYVKKAEKLFKDRKIEFGFDDYVLSCSTNLGSYYSFWRIKLLCLLDVSVLNRIEESKFDETVINNELGITKDELLKPNSMVVEKVRQYLSESKSSMNRR